jgi:hypothetical protein
LHHPNAQQARAALVQLLEWTVRDQNNTARLPTSARSIATGQRQ